MSSDFVEDVVNYPREKKLHVDKLVSIIEQFYQSKIESNDLSSRKSYAALKSTEDSRRFRETGLDLIKKGISDECFALFNQSLASAPLGSVELYLAHAARSSSSFAQSLYYSCTVDIDHAMLSKELSNKMRKELQERRKEATSRRKRQVRFAEKGKSLDQHHAFVYEREVFNLQLEYLSTLPSALDTFDMDNDCLPNTSSQVKLQFKDASSYIVATREIQAGCVISAEECFSKTLNKDCRFKQCEFCFIRFPFMTPCRSCTQVMYCSEVCRERAYKAYHQIECRMMNYFEDDTLHQAVRLLLVGTNQGKTLSKLMKKISMYDIMIDECRPLSEQTFATDYLTFLSTLRNKRLWDETNNLRREMTVPVAVNTVIALRNVSFFGHKDGLPDRLSKKEIFVALLLVDQLVLLKRFGHKISWQSLLEKEPRNQTIGEAFFPVQNLFGRSCYPNCQSFMQCGHRFLFTTRLVRSGEVLSFEDPVLYVRKSFEERTADFANYPFICECEACLQEWPSFLDLAVQNIVFLKKKQKDIAICRMERERDSVKSILESDNKTRSRQENDPALQFLTTTTELISDMCNYELFKTPSYDLILLETLLRKIMTQEYSDFKWLKQPLTNVFFDTFDVILTRLKSAEINWSGKEDFSKCQQFEQEATIEIPLTSGEHRTTSDLVSEEDDNSSISPESERVLLEELEACNKLYKTFQELTSQVGSNHRWIDGEENKHSFPSICTTVLSEENPSKAPARKTSEVCPTEHSVRENRQQIKNIETLRTEFKQQKSVGTDGTVPKDLMESHHERRIKMDSDPQSENDQKTCDEKIDEETFDESTLLAFIDNIYQSQLESSNIFDQCYADEKSEEACQELRLLTKTSLGKTGYKDKVDMVEAHSHLCSSIAFAPDNSEELTLAYAERSAIVFQMNEIDGCLRDVNRAIALGKCHKPLRKILQARKEECLRILSRNKDQPKLNRDDVTDPSGAEKFSFSTKLNILEDNSSGFVAKEIIMPGEELIKEKFEVTAVNETERLLFCSHCLVPSMTLIPCTTCTQFMFCSEKCLNEAYESYHRSECQMVKFYWRNERYEPFVGEIIALRAFFIGTKQGKVIPELLANFKRLYGTSEEGGDSAKLTCVEDFLVAVKSYKSLVKKLKLALPPAVEMVIALRSFAFFSEKYSKPPPRLSEEEILSTLLIAMNLISMGERKFALLAQVDPGDLTVEKPIGYGIYIEQNRVKNSCYPNAVSVYHRGYRYLYSCRTIEEGEPVTFSDMCPLQHYTLEERKKIYAAEGLICKCEACLEDWPSGIAFRGQNIQFKGDNSKESVITSLKEVRKKYSNTIHANELHSLICDCISVLCDGLEHPSPDIVVFEQLLKQVLKIRNYERYSDCWEIIRKNFISTYVQLMKRLKFLT